MAKLRTDTFLLYSAKCISMDLKDYIKAVDFTICVDFDNTLADTKYPEIIGLKPFAKETLENWHELGIYVIISSCRAGQFEYQMRKYLEEQQVYFDRINCNNPARQQKFKEDCRKISADVYIDDRSYLNFFKPIDWKEIDMLVSKILEKQKEEFICSNEQN